MEPLDLGSEDGAVPRSAPGKKSTSRLYSREEKTAAVRMVPALRADWSIEHGIIQPVTQQLGYGVESVRSRIRQVDIDHDCVEVVSRAEAVRVKRLRGKSESCAARIRSLKRALIFRFAKIAPNVRAVGARAGIVVTGTEVLTGRVADRNGPWIADRLLELGVELAHITICGDRRHDIEAQLRFMADEGVDLIVTSGGLGPTADDMTVATVARFC